MLQLLPLLNTLLPSLLALYKEVRDANPNQPSLTDDQIIDLLKLKGQSIVNKADAWLAAHPKG